MKIVIAVLLGVVSLTQVPTLIEYFGSHGSIEEAKEACDDWIWDHEHELPSRSFHATLDGENESAIHFVRRCVERSNHIELQQVHESHIACDENRCRITTLDDIPYYRDRLKNEPWTAPFGYRTEGRYYYR